MAGPPTIAVLVDGAVSSELAMKPYAKAGKGSRRCRVKLNNMMNPDDVVFSFLTSNKQSFVVRPAKGVIRGSSTCDVEVTSSAPAGEGDKFRLQLAWLGSAKDAAARWEELDGMGKSEQKSVVGTQKLTVKDVDDASDDPVPEEEPEADGAPEAEAQAGEEAETESLVEDSPAMWAQARNKGYSVTTTQAGDGYSFPQKGDRVLVHYTGMLREDGSTFDSSRQREPFATYVGMGRVIKGWDEGLREMAQGERAVLRVTADFAYQDKGFDDKVPPGADLLFDIELLQVSPRPTDAKVRAYSEEQRFEIITGFYAKHDAAKTEAQIRDILKKDKYKADFSKLCKMLQKKYDENPAVLWWSEQKLTQPEKAPAAAPLSPPGGPAFPGASEKLSFDIPAAGKPPAFGMFGGSSSAATGGLFAQSSTPAFSFTAPSGSSSTSSTSSGSAAAGKPMFGAPSALGVAQPTFGSTSLLGAAPAQSSSQSSAPSFNFSSSATGFAGLKPSSAPVFNFASKTASSEPSKTTSSETAGLSTSAGATSSASASGSQPKLSDMSVSQVGQWVDGLNLSVGNQAFAENHVDGEVLAELTDAVLRTEFGATDAAERQQLLQAVLGLKANQEALGEALAAAAGSPAATTTTTTSPTTSSAGTPAFSFSPGTNAPSFTFASSDAKGGAETSPAAPAPSVSSAGSPATANGATQDFSPRPQPSTFSFAPSSGGEDAVLRPDLYSGGAAPAAASPAPQPAARPAAARPERAYSQGEMISAMPASVSGGHCFLSSNGAGILVAHARGHGGDASLCVRGAANASIAVGENGSGTAVLDFEPGALAVDTREPVAANAPAGAAASAGPPAMTADMRLRELEYKDAMEQNAKLRAQVEELGGGKAAKPGAPATTSAADTPAANRSSITCLASGDGSEMGFSNPNFVTEGHEVKHIQGQPPNGTFRASASVTEGRWYYEVQLLDSAESAKVGFACGGFTPRGMQGVGDDEFSWAFDGSTLQKWHNGGTPAAV